MKSKPKAYAFLENKLEEAGFGKGHWPGYIKELYPILHKYIADNVDSQVLR